MHKYIFIYKIVNFMPKIKNYKLHPKVSKSKVLDLS